MRRLACILMLLAVTSCGFYTDEEIEEHEEESSWWGHFYGTSKPKEDPLCSFYGNCQGSGGSVDSNCSFYGTCKKDRPEPDFYNPSYGDSE